MSDQLSDRERAILLALTIHDPDREVTNRDLDSAYGLHIKPAERDKLVSQGHLLAVRGRGAGYPFLHTLTEQGRLRAEAELSENTDIPKYFNPRITYGLLNKVKEFLSRNYLDAVSVLGPRPAQMDDAEVDSAISEAISSRYHDLAGDPGSWVMLRELREGLNHVNRGQVDDTLVRLFKGRRIHLIAESNQKTLTPDDHAACVTISGDDKHLISIG